jgi:beta-galactosidase
MLLKRTALLILAAVLTTAALSAQTPRKHLLLDEGWRFHLGHAADATKDFNFTIANLFSKTGKAAGTAVDPKFDDQAWASITLPHDWAVTLPFENSDNADVMGHGYKPVGGLYPQNSIGWYRKTFGIVPTDSGKRFSIQFDGVFRDCQVWLNGFYLGRNESGYVGFEYDITDYIQFKQENVLVVRVDASQYEGWFYEGAGIYRHVWLNQYENLHVASNGVFFQSTVTGRDATIAVQTSVMNDGLAAGQGSVLTYITDRNGKVLVQAAEKPVALSGQATAVVQQELTIKDARLWSLQDPYLYKVVSVVKQNGRVVDQVRRRLGIRTVTIEAATGLSLNGKRIKIQGVNCHQDHAGVGSALPDYLHYYRIRRLQELGVNAYRTSHHAPTPELLDACDSLGMLVLDEARLLSSSAEYQDQFRRLIERDRNHPSVFLWSIGNEEGYAQTNSFGKRIALSMLALQRQLDPTRTSTYAADLGNVFPGVNEVIPIRGFNYREKHVVAYHQDHLEQPILGTEMGSTVTTRGIYAVDSVKGYVPDQDITAPWWASTAEAWWPLAAENDWFMGGFVWTGFDYRGEPTPFQWPNISSHFGIMDVCGFPKNIYYYYQSWWTDKDVLHISPHWNWKGQEGKNIDVWVNSSADRVELFLNGKSLGKKAMPRNRHLQWSVPYRAGILSAVGTKQGRTIRTQVQTTDVPNVIELSTERTIVLADGCDAAVINVTVKDTHGREVPDADNLVRFSLQGDARLIGVGNGDPSSHEADQCAPGAWQRSLFNGKCQVIIQAGKTAGAIRLDATSDGLRPAVATLQATVTK